MQLLGVARMLYQGLIFLQQCHIDNTTGEPKLEGCGGYSYEFLRNNPHNVCPHQVSGFDKRLLHGSCMALEGLFRSQSSYSVFSVSFAPTFSNAWAIFYQ